MAALKGDFIGFQYGDIHSSELGLVRTSSSSRYTETTSPEIRNKFIEKPGADGMIFLNSHYAQKPFMLNIAYDHVTEVQKRLIQQTFNNKTPQKLIFDETPYKYYVVKPDSAPDFQFLAFTEKGERIYKGEGSIPLIAYFPYARSVYKTLSEYKDVDNYEWAEASGLKENLVGYDIYNNNHRIINLFNPGDLEAFNSIFIKFDNKLIGSGIISVMLDDETKMELNPITAMGDDDEICINSYNYLIEGYSQGKKSGNIYNKYILSGAFFNIPLGESILQFGGLGDNEVTINYQYLYY
jgi:predicted phage tail component-like protein